MKTRNRYKIAVIGVLVAFGMLSGMLLPDMAAAQVIPPPERVDTKLLEELQANGSADFVIEMSEQADLSAAYTISDWNARGQYVVDTLKGVADRSQKNARGQLARQGAKFTSYFINNSIVVRGGNQNALNAVVNLPEVARVRAPIVVRLEPVDELLGQAVDIKWPQAQLEATTAWGLTDTSATSFWSSYGRQGEGIIVANIDTGVRYDHPALAAAYLCAGGNLLDPKCWHDATTDPQQTGPQDDQGHGTHTMGTMVGSNNPALTNIVGMAPKAKWIACRAFIGTTTTDADLLECANWILAPGGNVANRPHVVNNSWGDKTSDPWFASSVNAWFAAGIFPVFSAGNDGDTIACGAIGSPADYQKGFTVAAHDQNRLIAFFSSKGPNTLGDIPYTKPNISAPGVLITSSIISGGFGLNSGTSMAAPHASGAVALLWSCNPALVGQIDQTFQALQNSAGLPPAGACGAPGTGGNYTYGYGFLNVLQAGQGQCITWMKTYLPLISNGTAAPVPANPIQNGGFEAGDAVWSESSSNGWDLILTQSQLTHVAHTGDWQGWLGGDDLEISAISQTVTIPVGRSFLHYWIDSRSADLCDFDYFTIFVGGALIFSESICTSTATGAWVHRTLDLAAYAGTIQTIKFQVETDELEASSAFLDDISLQPSNTLSAFGLNGPLENYSGPELLPDTVRTVKEE